MNIDNVLDSIMQFYSRLSIQTGLKDWQLLTIALAVLFGLILFLNYLRKVRIKIRHAIQSSSHSDIIGIRLANKRDDYRAHDTFRNKQAIGLPEEEQQSWGQTTKDWRKLREKIRHLQHDIGKHERSEKHLKEQIMELKITNEKLQAEINKQSQIEETLQQQINELTSTIPVHNQAEQTIATEHLLSQSSEKQDNAAETNLQEDVEMSDTTEKEHNVPLDIKELKAIADLVKRLQARNQQRQIE